MPFRTHNIQLYSKLYDIQKTCHKLPGVVYTKRASNDLARVKKGAPYREGQPDVGETKVNIKMSIGLSDRSSLFERRLQQQQQQQKQPQSWRSFLRHICCHHRATCLPGLFTSNGFPHFPSWRHTWPARSTSIRRIHTEHRPTATKTRGVRKQRQKSRCCIYQARQERQKSERAMKDELPARARKGVSGRTKRAGEAGRTCARGHPGKIYIINNIIEHFRACRVRPTKQIQYIYTKTKKNSATTAYDTTGKKKKECVYISYKNHTQNHQTK